MKTRKTKRVKELENIIRYNSTGFNSCSQRLLMVEVAQREYKQLTGKSFIL